MRVLVAHNDYVSANPSGERRVVADDQENLRAAGVDVRAYLRSSDEIPGLSKARRAELLVRPAYSHEDSRRVAEVLRAERIDLLHLHNPYPLISPSIVRVARAAGVPVVQTVHNYRMACVNGSFFRDGEICVRCVTSRLPVPAIAHACYRGSRSQSVVMAATLTVHRPTWRTVDRFLPVTPFMVRHLLDAGIPAERITPKPNTVRDPGPATAPGRGLLFAGRLVAEKGVAALLAGWERYQASGGGWLGELTLVGDGPLRPDVERAARDLPGVHYLGPVTGKRVDELMRAAAAVAVPSLWFEGFPMTVLEAYARGRGVLATRVGSVGTVVDDEVGWRAAGTAPGHIAQVLRSVDAAGAAARGAAARSRYEASYTPKVVTAQLIGVYEDVLARHRARRPGTVPAHP
jgi:glycosyltransferase involved in cell wall biosynthesis